MSPGHTTGEKKKSKVKKVLGEFKRKTLKSGSGNKVKNRKQAIAIALSESGQSKDKGNPGNNLSPEMTKRHKARVKRIKEIVKEGRKDFKSKK